MYCDPFLLDHEVAPCEYELSSGVLPVSVRDQVLRGSEITARLIAYGITPPGTGRLLIVGGGIAGFSAALKAATSGVSVTILEANSLEEDSTYFPLFAKCTSRRIDPTFYDWPQPHWRTHTFVPPNPHLAFSPNEADKLANIWHSVISQERSKAGSLLEVRFNTPFAVGDVTYEHNRIRYILPNSGSYEIYDAVLYTAGMGDEKVWLDDQIPPDEQYCGPRFWTSDTFDHPWCGRSTQPAVLIAGSGDGALQDYIRILTGKHPAAVLEDLDNALQGKNGWQESQHRLLVAQEKAARQYVLGCKGDAKEFHKNRDLAIEQDIHTVFDIEAGSIFNLYQSDIKRVLDSLIKQRKADLPHTLHLLITGQAFTWCYAANRFLVLLLSKYLSPHYHPDGSLLGQTLLYRHTLKKKEKDGKQVTVVSGRSRPKTRSQYDIVIIRRGIKRSNSLSQSNKAPRERCLMPHYFVPIIT